ncbi:MAG: hypothetical protein HWE16_03715 [Gammaproteobacteria bacterium]|nr:hypothetical protein [Gammaproteobacteria bacterium]
MKDFSALILSETKTLNEQHKNVHVTYKDRKNSRSAMEQWNRACEIWHSYRSELDHYLDRVFKDFKINDKEIKEFVITFLELNPWFFRSGYIKADLLIRIKRSYLTEEDKKRLRVVLLNAVLRIGTREYKKYCSLAMAIHTENFISELKTLSKEKSPVCSRAKLMLRYINPKLVEYYQST